MRGRLVIGLILLVLGIGFFLDAIDVPRGFDFGDTIGRYWPIVLIFIGLMQLTTSVVAGTVLIIIGTAFLLHNLDILKVSVWALVWPSLLIIIGASLLFSRVHGKHTVGHHEGKVVETTGRIDRMAAFGGFDERVHGTLRQASLTAMFGGGEFDLREAELPPEGADIEATAMFGGIEILVPKHWTIDLKGPGIFGGVANKTTNVAGGPTLRIKAVAIFGAVEVKNEKR